MVKVSFKDTRILIGVFVAAIILIVTIFCFSDKVDQAFPPLSVIDNRADNMTHMASGFVNIPIEAHEIAPAIYQATGIANTYLIVTENSHVLFDTGHSSQAAKQIAAFNRLIKRKPLSHIILSHSHINHTGGTNIWRYPETKIIAHIDSWEKQKYVKAFQPYLRKRNALLTPSILDETPTLENLHYGYSGADITVLDFETYRFEEGGRKFEVIGMPSVNGNDNVVLWMPKEKVLFSGNILGPVFPQFPNIFTMRGEKIRKPTEYIKTLDKIIALSPSVIVPTHFQPITDKKIIREGLNRMRDAVSYVHDATMTGMNAGKTLHELMEEITLPPELRLSQSYGKVSWAVKAIWEYYTSQFHFDSITSLYAVSDTTIYKDLVKLSGQEALNARIKHYLDIGKPIHALHLIKIAKADKNATDWIGTQKLHRQALQALRRRAERGTKNVYEIHWLDSQIKMIGIK